MRNHNSSSFSSESSDSTDSKSEASSKKSSAAELPNFSVIFNQNKQPAPPAPAEQPPLLHMLESIDAQSKEDSEKETKDSKNANDSTAKTTKPTAPRRAPISSILNRDQQSKESTSEADQESPVEPADELLAEQSEVPDDTAIESTDQADIHINEQSVELPPEPVFTPEDIDKLPGSETESTEETEQEIVDLLHERQTDDEDSEFFDNEAKDNPPLSVMASANHAPDSNTETADSRSSSNSSSSGTNSSSGGAGSPPPSNGPGGSGGGGQGGGPGNPNNPPGPGGPQGPNGPPPVPPGFNAGPQQQFNTVPVINQNQAPTAPNTIIRERNTGAALAFMGALYLNRRRKKDIKRLRREDKSMQNQLEAARARIQHVETVNRSLQQDLQRRNTIAQRTERTQDQAIVRAQSDATEALKRPISEGPADQAIARQAKLPVAEKLPSSNINNLYEKTINNTQETTINQATEAAAAVIATEAVKEKVEKPGPVPIEQVIQNRYEKVTKEVAKTPQTEQVIQSPSETKVRTANESIISAKREAADDKATALFAGAPTAATQQPASNHMPSQDSRPQIVVPHNPALTPYTPENPIFQNPNDPKDIYKQSMQAGFMIGIAAVVLGSIAYFVLR